MRWKHRIFSLIFFFNLIIMEFCYIFLFTNSMSITSVSNSTSSSKINFNVDSIILCSSSDFKFLSEKRKRFLCSSAHQRRHYENWLDSIVRFSWIFHAIKSDWILDSLPWNNFLVLFFIPPNSFLISIKIIHFPYPHFFSMCLFWYF